MRFILFSILNFFLFIGISAQSLEIDSLRKELSLTKDVSKQLDIQIVLAHQMAMVNLDSVKHYAGNVVRISKKHNDYKNLCHGYLKYALGYFVFRTIPKSSDLFWAYMDSAYNVADKHDYYHGITAYYQLKAVYYMETSDFEKSIENMLMVTQRCKIEKDSLSFAFSIYNLADIYSLSGQYEKALKMIQDNMDIIDNLKYDNIYFYIQTLMGKLYGDLKMYDKSLSCYKIVYDNQYLKVNSASKLEIIQNLAYGFYSLEMKDSADYYFREVIKLSKSDDGKSIKDENYYTLSKYLLEKKEYHTAEKYLLVTLQYSKQNAAAELYVLTDLAKLYEAKQDFGKALVYVNRYIQLKDSIKLEGLDYLLDKATTDMQLKAKIKELNQMESKMIKRKSIIIIYFILSVLLYFAFWYMLTGILYRFYKIHLNISQKEEAKSLWTYVPPQINTNYLSRLFASLFFILLNLLSFKYLIQIQSGIFQLIIWLLISGLLFLVSEKTFSFFTDKQKNISFLRELLVNLIRITAIVIVLTVLATLTGLIENSSPLIIQITVLLLGNILITLNIHTLIGYRARFDALNESVIKDLNSKLAKRKEHVEQSVPIKDDIVEIDNAGKSVAIDLNKILYIVSENVYQEFICIDNEKITKILVRNTLNTIEKQLENHSDFLRCHRSYIVNTNYITSLEGNSRQQFFIMDRIKDKIPVSRSLANDILGKFEKLVNN